MTSRRPIIALAGALTAVLVASVGLAPPAGAATVSYTATPLASWRTNGPGYAVLVVGNVVYVGGSFSSTVNASGGSSTSRANLAAFSASTGALITTFRADTNGIVRALATDGTRLFVGGQFTTVNGVSRSRVAAVSLSTGAVQGFTANASSNVYALAVGGGQLFVGGSFGSLKGATRTRVGAVRISDGALTSFAPNLNNTVLALAATADGSRVYVGGNFTTVNGAATPYLAGLTGTGSVAVTWSRVSAQVIALSLRSDGTRLGVSYGGYTNSTAYYNTSSGARLWIYGCDGDAQAVAVIADSVLAGYHEGCHGNTSTKLVSYNAANGATDTSFAPTINSFYGVHGISGTTALLAVAGEFTTISGRSVRGFAIFPKR